MKKKIIKTVIGTGILGMAAAIYVYSFVINKPHPDYENIEPEYIMLAADLFEKYRSNRNLAEENYNGRVIQLNGRLDYIEHNDSLLIGVFVFDQGMFGEEGIRCTMLSNQSEKLSSELSGRQIRLKGYVTGYNDTDVILESCSIMN